MRWVQIVGGPKDGQTIEVPDHTLHIAMPEWDRKASFSAFRPVEVAEPTIEPEYIIVGNSIKVRHLPRPKLKAEPEPEAVLNIKVIHYQIREAYRRWPDGTVVTWHVALHPDMDPTAVTLNPPEWARSPSGQDGLSQRASSSQ